MAVSFLYAVFGKCGILYYYPITKAVTESVDLVRNVGVAAVAGVCGVALILTGGRSNHRVVVVTKSANFLRVGMRAVTGERHNSLIYTVGSGGYNTLVVSVTKSVNPIRNVRVTTMTSIGCVTLILTGRSGYDRVVVVSESRNFLRVEMRAVTGERHNSLIYTVGSGGYNTAVVSVTERGDLVGNVGVAAVAGVCGVAHFFTGGRSNNRLVIVSERIYGQGDS